MYFFVPETKGKNAEEIRQLFLTPAVDTEKSENLDTNNNKDGQNQKSLEFEVEMKCWFLWMFIHSLHWHMALFLVTGNNSNIELFPLARNDTWKMNPLTKEFHRI